MVKILGSGGSIMYHKTFGNMTHPTDTVNKPLTARAGTYLFLEEEALTQNVLTSSKDTELIP